MITKKGKPFTIIATLAAVAIVLAAGFAALRARPELSLTYDPAYWPSTSAKTGEWHWCLTPSGINYSLYVPAALDREDATPTIPLIVVFHGSTQKAIAKDRFGRIFTTPEMQRRLDANGAAVLAVQSRVEYFSDPHAYARLIENVVMQHHCIDKTRIAGFGFSQGAAFVQELAMYEPSLFRAVASGSSYYSASPPELFRAARTRFWCATSRNDKGIFEQGHVTGKILSAICPDSRYVEYEKRGHFYVEPGDKSGKGKETFTDWLAKALAR